MQWRLWWRLVAEFPTVTFASVQIRGNSKNQEYLCIYVCIYIDVYIYICIYISIYISIYLWGLLYVLRAFNSPTLAAPRITEASNMSQSPKPRRSSCGGGFSLRSLDWFKTPVWCQGVGLNPWKMKLKSGTPTRGATHFQSRFGTKIKDCQPHVFPEYQHIPKSKSRIAKTWNQWVPRVALVVPWHYLPLALKNIFLGGSDPLILSRSTPVGLV